MTRSSRGCSRSCLRPRRAPGQRLLLALTLVCTLPLDMRRAAAQAPGAGTPTAPRPAPPSGVGLGDELEAMEQAVGRFEAAQRDYRGTVSHIVGQEYDKKRKDLLARYQSGLAATEAGQKQRREEAIALFEQFLARYPDNRRWTPDAIFRLAELYFEKTTDDFLAQDSGAGEPNDDAATTTAKPANADYSKTIALYKRLVTDFPDYRLLDAALYLLGFCLDKAGEELPARQAFLALTCANRYEALATPAEVEPSRGPSRRGAVAAAPDPYADCQPVRAGSRFLPEAWTRVGEYHFDDNELERAIAAYSQVLPYKDSPYYDKALYKLAWSYYRADRYPDAIRRFDELVLFSDARKAESGKGGSELRNESLQYLGISFAEKDWNGDAIDDKETGLARLGAFYQGRDNEPHVREVYHKLGDVYFDETDYQRAIEVYKTALGRWPLAPENPKIQDRIVLAYERLRDFQRAIDERSRLAKDYQPGSAWDKSNRDNPDARASARELAEQSLSKYAISHHHEAIALKKLAVATRPPDNRKLALAAEEYARAADGYKRYLEQYPNSRNAYDYTFGYAEALYYVGRFAEAAVQYEAVRDSNLDNRLVEDAAFNAIKSYEYLLDEERKAGKLVYPELPQSGKVTPPIQPLEIPDTVARLQRAYDVFVTRVPSSGRIATLAYKAGELDYRYLHWPEARKRFEAILTKYCHEPAALEAGRAIMTSYTIESDLDQIVVWTDKLDKLGCGGTTAERKQVEGERKRLKDDARFRICDRYLESKDYEQAAPCFIGVVDASPKNEGGNNDKALNNAAVAYEAVKRFFAATKVYERIVTEYPKSEFVDEALFRTAVNYQRFFEFDKAVVAYKRLATDVRFKASNHHTDALYNAAQILENDQAYDEAARLFQSYAQAAGAKPDEAAEAYLRSGRIYLKSKDASRALKTFREYLKRYAGADPRRVLEGNYRIAEALELAKDHNGALAQYRKVAQLGAGVPPASEPAEFAAEAAFRVAEAALPTLERLRLSSRTSELAASLKKFEAEVARQRDAYEKVLPYRRATWLLAAYFRLGYVFELYSRALGELVNSPCPAEVQRKHGQEGCDVYLEQLRQEIESRIAGVDEEVIKRYRTTLEQAAKLGVSNEWTRRARQQANAYKPDEFPLMKDEHVDYQMEPPR